ncbi:MAG: sigma-70 family RNA polymerase sigma factor [Fibrella sp.]|nr:sigma-70 family RNA polymerase sigma factor [Armatimonadota bacterium]
MTALLPIVLEASLRKRLRENDRAAFEAVVKARYVAVYRQLYYLTGGDETRAADLTQETFVAAWQSLSSFDGRSAIGTWLHTIAVRVWYRTVREGERRVSPIPLAEALAELLADPAAVDPARNIAVASERATLEAAVNALPPAYRHAVLLFYREEMRYREIADAEGIAIGTVKSRLSTALKLLRERLADRKEELL